MHSRITEPTTENGLALASYDGPVVVEYDGLPDKGYQAFAKRIGIAYPFSSELQVSRIQFADGLMKVAANGHSHTEISQEGYWAFRGIGDRVPVPIDMPSANSMAARLP